MSLGVGLDGHENIYLADKFDKLVMIYNSGMFLCYIKGKYEALYAGNELHQYVTNTSYWS